jgi:DNA-binding response OmpR family regulator
LFNANAVASGLVRSLQVRENASKWIAVARSQSSSRSRIRRVLLVEEDARLRDALSVALADEGFEVTPVRDSEQARRVLLPLTNTIGLLVLDVTSADARALLNELAQLDRSVPVVATSTVANDALFVANAYSIPALTKPFELPLFLATITTSFDHDIRPKPKSRGATLRRRHRIA